MSFMLFMVRIPKDTRKSAYLFEKVSKGSLIETSRFMNDTATSHCAAAGSEVLFARNLAALAERYPALRKRALSCAERDRIEVLSTPQGLAYAIRVDDGLRLLNDPAGDTARLLRSLEAESAALANLQKPVWLAGLSPGDEALHLFEYCERQPQPHPEQPLHVCAQSLPVLIGFLKAFDARALLTAKRVRLFLADETDAEIAWLERRPDFPHQFTIVSGLPEADVNAQTTPLRALAARRDRQGMNDWQENAEWYRNLDDRRLAAILAGAGEEAPRLLMPTAACSTVTQHAARSLQIAMTELGWEVRHLNPDWMITPHWLIGEIRRFKPHALLFIDHLRTEALRVYPPDLLFVTWVQDAMPAINSPSAATVWNDMARPRRRDLLVGYTDQLRPFGYLPERRLPLPMIVDRATFAGREADGAEPGPFACDVCFASNCGRPPAAELERSIGPSLAKIAQDSAARTGSPSPLSDADATGLARMLHDHLWARYRAGRTFITYAALDSELAEASAPFTRLRHSLDPEGRHALTEFLFWSLNDPIYRHTVLEWLDELGADMRLYGDGWAQHPRFRRYAAGKLAHGEELAQAYRAARFSLHLNAAEGGHQRIAEILASGGRVLTRYDASRMANASPELQRGWRWLAQRLRTGGASDAEAFRLETLDDSPARMALADWLFQQALALTATESDQAPDRLAARLAQRVEQGLTARLDVLAADGGATLFNDRDSLTAALAALSGTPSSGATSPAGFAHHAEAGFSCCNAKGSRVVFRPRE